MITAVRKLHSGVVNVDTNDVCHLDFYRSGIIVAVYFDLMATLTANASWARWELSFSSTSQLDTNDSSGSIASATASLSLVTSGASNNVSNSLINGISVPVKQGQRIYLNLDVNGTIANSRCTCFIYCAEK